MMNSDNVGGRKRFEFSWDTRYRLAALPFGLLPSSTWVEIDDSELFVHYGLWKLRTTLDNVVGVEASGPFAFLKTAGPPHLSFSDRGISFTTNGRHGLCVSFREPVPGIDPTGIIKHPGATFTVVDPVGFASALGYADSI